MSSETMAPTSIMIAHIFWNSHTSFQHRRIEKKQGLVSFGANDCKTLVIDSTLIQDA